MPSTSENYNKIIKEEMKRGRRSTSQRDSGSSSRDEAVRRANVRTGYGNSTAQRHMHDAATGSKSKSKKSAPGKRAPGKKRFPDEMTVPGGGPRPDPMETGGKDYSQFILDALLLAAGGAAGAGAYRYLRKPGDPEAPGVMDGPSRANIDEYGQDFGPTEPDEPRMTTPDAVRTAPPIVPPPTPDQGIGAPQAPMYNAPPVRGGGGQSEPGGLGAAIMQSLGIDEDTLRHIRRGVR